jgi:hypothetical protein
MAAPQRMSSQMEAVVRLLSGKEERTIAQKLADSNRPTWEQYKKDNHDKLNLSGVDQQKMEEYRKELDEQREKLLAARGNGDKGRKNKKKEKRHRRKHMSSESDVSDDSSEEDERRHKARRKEKKRKKKHSRRHDNSSDESSSTSEGERKKKKKRSKNSRIKDEEQPEDNRYKLSSFFDNPEDKTDS